MSRDDQAADYLALSEAELLRQCRVETFRGTGPGGQKRNKTESAVRIRHLPTGIAGHSDDTRSQHTNRDTALRRLRQHLALELRRLVDVDTYAPSLALRQLLAQKGRVPGRRAGADLFAVAELLDLFVALDCSVRDTAARLAVSTAALSKLLLHDEKITTAVNALRAERHLRALR
jgi:hypothetical protein